MRRLHHILQTLAALLFLVLGTQSAAAIPTNPQDITVPLAQTANLPQPAQTNSTTRAPPLTGIDLAITGGDITNQVRDLALHEQETVAALFGFGEDLVAPNSVDDVGDLFRGDGRPHEQVFDEGLVPWDPDGTLPLEVHVNSNPSPTTGNQWTSTSTDPNIAASSDFSGPGGTVYQIDGNVPGKVDVNQTLGVDNVDFSYESEIAIPGGIDTCFIRGCNIVQPDGSLGDFIPNPNYTGGQ